MKIKLILILLLFFNNFAFAKTKFEKRFENFIVKYHNKIVDLDYIIDIADPNAIQNIANFLVEKTLKTARLFK